MFRKVSLLSVVFLSLSIQLFAQSGDVKFSRSASSFESAEEFNSGDFIFAHIKFTKPLGEMLNLSERPVTLIAEFYINEKMIDDEMFGFESANVKNSKQTSIVLPVISDPATNAVNFGKNVFAIRMPGAFSKLSEGTHSVQMKVKSYEYKDANELLGSGTFYLTIDGGSKAWFLQNEKAAMAAFSDRGVKSVVVSARDAAMGVVGGTSVITLVNNCGRSVWLRKASGSDKTEYRLGSGQTMRYDRDAGYLEEWNFGTKKWSTVTKVWTADSKGNANICSK